jgi:hypothetical protein
MGIVDFMTKQATSGAAKAAAALMSDGAFAAKHSRLIDLQKKLHIAGTDSGVLRRYVSQLRSDMAPHWTPERASVYGIV